MAPTAVLVACWRVAQALATSAGLFAYHAGTEANLSVTVRTPDGTGSGYASSGATDWAVIDPRALGRLVVELAAAPDLGQDRGQDLVLDARHGGEPKGPPPVVVEEARSVPGGRGGAERPRWSRKHGVLSRDHGARDRAGAKGQRVMTSSGVTRMVSPAGPCQR